MENKKDSVPTYVQMNFDYFIKKERIRQLCGQYLKVEGQILDNEKKEKLFSKLTGITGLGPYELYGIINKKDYDNAIELEKRIREYLRQLWKN